MSKSIFIRPMEEKDLDAVMKIEEESFIDPWRLEDMYYDLYENPIAHLLVLTYDDVVLGFASYWVTYNSATIAQIAISEDARGVGLATLLLNDIIRRVSMVEEVKMMTLEVRESNLAARKLYLKNGFFVSHKKLGYYADGENAIYMMREMRSNENLSN